MAGPTWYDILGVPQDATAEQIKAAWRESTDKFEPGSGASQFRLFNEAAEVLLDPAKRAAYDGEIGHPEAPAAEPEPEPEPEPAPEPDVATEAPEDHAAPTTEVADPAPAPAKRTRVSLVTGVLGSTLGLAILAVLAVAAVVLTVVLAINLDDRAADAKAGPEASSVAERALPAVLGYDYRRMDEDRDAAVKFMTPSYAKIYTRNFEGLISGTDANPGGAAKLKSVVTATVISTGVVDADRDRVRVLVFVNQNPVADGKAKPTLANRVVATMVRRGDTWLLDDLKPIGAGF